MSLDRSLGRNLPKLQIVDVQHKSFVPGRLCCFSTGGSIDAVKLSFQEDLGIMLHNSQAESFVPRCRVPRIANEPELDSLTQANRQPTFSKTPLQGALGQSRGLATLGPVECPVDMQLQQQQQQHSADRLDRSLHFQDQKMRSSMLESYSGWATRLDDGSSKKNFLNKP